VLKVLTTFSFARCSSVMLYGLQTNESSMHCVGRWARRKSLICGWTHRDVVDIDAEIAVGVM
jgi:hypothetical protein